MEKETHRSLELKFKVKFSVKKKFDLFRLYRESKDLRREIEMFIDSPQQSQCIIICFTNELENC